MKLLVTGGTGFLGSYLLRQLAKVDSLQILSLQRSEFEQPGTIETVIGDLTTMAEHERMLKAFAPDCIVHLASISSPAQSEENASLAEHVIVDGSAALCDIATAVGAQLIFLSSDWVFDSNRMQSGGFQEQTVPVCRTVYGKLKREVEKLVLAVGNGSAVIRSSLMYGAELNGRKSTMSWLEEGLTRLGSIDLLEDEWRTPVFVDDVVYCICKVMERGASGVFHSAGPERLSRLEFGQLYAECFGISTKLIRPVKRKDIQQLSFRPEDLSLNCDETCTALDIAFRSPRQAFEFLRDQQGDQNT